MTCEMCQKGGDLELYLVDDNVEVRLHPACAKALRAEVTVERMES